MRVIFLLFCCFYAIFLCSAWILPERCQNNQRRRRSSSGTTNVTLVPSIKEVAAKHHARLLEDYKDYKLKAIPTKVTRVTDSMFFHTYGLHDCRIVTPTPRVLDSLTCVGADCKLSRSVSTVDTFESSEGFTWGATVSAKLELFKIIEVGGEASMEKSYSCTFTRGKTVTNSLECAGPIGKSGSLRLYIIKSDVQCDYGKKLLRHIEREPFRTFDFVNHSEFTTDEMKEIVVTASISTPYSGSKLFAFCFKFIINENCFFMIDINKISNCLYQKIMKLVPLYDVYTDVILINRNDFTVLYEAKDFTEVTSQIKIPFTNENGDSEFEYACVFEPL